MASKKPDSTLVVLREIRDEIKKTNVRLDGTNARLDGTNDRVDALERRLTETEVRLSTAIADLAGTVGTLIKTLRDTRDGEIEAIKARLTAVEHKVS